MPTYIGFSTQQLEQVRNPQLIGTADGGTGSITKPVLVTKKFRMVDAELVIQDFLNSLNIPQGSKPGRPNYGTTLWSFMFEPNTVNLQNAIETEIVRMAGLDPRLLVNNVVSYPQDKGILVEIEIAVSPFNLSQQLAIQFDAETGRTTATSSTGNTFMIMPGVSR